MILLICGILRNDTHELIYKTEILTDIENKLIATKYQRGEAGARGRLGIGDSGERRRARACCIAQGLYSHSGIACMRGESGKERTRVCVCALSHFSRVRLSAAPWTAAPQAPLSMGFFRQEYWSGVPCPPPGDLPDPGMEPASLTSPALASRFFTTRAAWETRICVYV